jgi:hypothetical protein
MDFITDLPPTKIRTREVTNAILVIINRYKVFRILYYYNNNCRTDWQPDYKRWFPRLLSTE